MKNFWVRAVFFVLILALQGNKLNAEGKRFEGSKEMLSDVNTIVNNANQWITKIDNAVNAVQEGGVYKTLVEGEKMEAPYAILPDNENTDYALIINSIKMDAELGMVAEVFMKVPIGDGEYLRLLADNVPISGNSIQGDINLFLVKTINVPHGDGYTIQFKGLDAPNEEYSYITADCKGFKEIYVNGIVGFDPNTVKKKEEGTRTDTLALDFFVNADRLTNLVVQFRNIPELEFSKLPGFTCYVPEITLDLSDRKNAPKFKLPQWYMDTLAATTDNFDPTIYMSPLWEGLYVPTVTMVIPKAFSEGAATDSVYVTIEDVIIDQFGLTALANAYNLVDAGDMKGFKFELNHLHARMLKNTLTEANITGQMSFPVCKEDSKVEFGIAMTQNLENPGELEYDGYAKYDGKLNASAFGLAQLSLTQCDLYFNYSNNQFFPRVEISGSLDLLLTKKGQSNSSGNVGLDFSGLVINSTGDYLSLIEGTGEKGYIRMKTGNNSKLSKLPITLSSIGFESSEGGQYKGISATVEIKFQKSNGNDSDSGNGFAGSADFQIWARRNPGTKRWEYDDFNLSAIALEIDNGPFCMKGSLQQFSEHRTYGSGYCGQLSLKVIDKIEVSVAAIFGKVKNPFDSQYSLEDYEKAIASGEEMAFSSNESSDESVYRYWFVDGAVKLPGIPLAPGVELNSFTGGLYYNMEMIKSDTSGSTNMCPTATGRFYGPRKDVLGLIAGIGVQSTGGGNAFSGEINFSIEFFLDGGGLKRIATWGGVGIMKFDAPETDLSALADKMDTQPAGEEKKKDMEAEVEPVVQSAISVNWYVEYDFPNKTLNGDFDVFIDLAGVVEGLHKNKRAGRISVHSSPDGWYFYIGRPVENQTIGLKVIKMIDLQAYFCVGSILPDPAIMPLPPNLSADLDGIDYTTLNAGSGFSLGARVHASGEPGIGLGVCRARAECRYNLDAGFDILVSKSNEPVECAGRSSARGINDWYATGQAFIAGSAGIYVKANCFVFSFDSKVMDMSASSVVFAQLPNPSYMVGKIKASFGVFKWSFDVEFPFKMGEVCDSDFDVADVDYINAITPNDSSINVPVNTSIDVYFNLPVNISTSEYTMNTGEGNATYKGVVNEEQMTLITESGDEIPFAIEYSSDYTKMSIIPNKVLPENSLVEFNLSITTQKKEGNNWVNTSRIEQRTITFTTASEPNYIPVTNVLYAYPLPGMKNFYKDESSSGYVRLGTIPSKPLKLPENYEFTVSVYERGNLIDRKRNVSVSEEYGVNNFEFDIPTARLEQGRTYTLKIMKSPIPDFTTEGSTIEGAITTGTVESTDTDTLVLGYQFTVSEYESFSTKMSFYTTSFSEVFGGIARADLSINQAAQESIPFEEFSSDESYGYKLDGISTTDPLVQFGSLVDNKGVLAGMDVSDVVGNSFIEGGSDGGYNVANDALAALNENLRETNMNCLLSENGCSAAEVSNFTIPKGTFELPIYYYLPGQSTYNSSKLITLNIDEPITLPY